MSLDARCAVHHPFQAQGNRLSSKIRSIPCLCNRRCLLLSLRFLCCRPFRHTNPFQLHLLCPCLHLRGIVVAKNVIKPIKPQGENGFATLLCRPCAIRLLTLKRISEEAAIATSTKDSAESRPNDEISTTNSYGQRDQKQQPALMFRRDSSRRSP